MRVVSAENMETRRGPEEWFTGVVYMDAAPAGTSPRCRGLSRALRGEGRAQKEGEPLVGIGTGDVVYFAPGEKHWHGAEPDTFMVHVAINPAANSDGGTEWMEPVTDEEYSGKTG